MQTWAHMIVWLINGYALLPENDVSFFWVLLRPTHKFYQHETIFVWYFGIVTNTFKIYFWRQRINIFFWDMFDALKTSPEKRIFWDVFETSFLRCISRVLKTSQKRHLFEMFFRGIWDFSLNGDLFETSQRHLIPARIIRKKDSCFAKTLSMKIALKCNIQAQLVRLTVKLVVKDMIL